MKQPNFAAMSPAVAKAIEQMMVEQGDKFSLEKVNLAELERRTGISRARLRRMKEHDFEDAEHASKGRKASTTLLSGYTGILDGLLKAGVTNSAVCLSRLRANGYHGGKTIVKDYIAAHQHLVPPARYGYTTGPGEAFQMDWGFTKVQSFTGEEYSAACFASPAGPGRPIPRRPHLHRPTRSAGRSRRSGAYRASAGWAPGAGR